MHKAVSRWLNTFCISLAGKKHVFCVVCFFPEIFDSFHIFWGWEVNFLSLLLNVRLGWLCPRQYFFNIRDF